MMRFALLLALPLSFMIAILSAILIAICVVWQPLDAGPILLLQLQQDGSDADLFRVVDTRRRLSVSVGEGTAPRWSPDGSQIVFTQRVDDRLQLILSDRTFQKQTVLPLAGKNALYPQWSPDGCCLVWMETSSGQLIRRLDRDSGEISTVMNLSYPMSGLMVSAEGNHLLMTTALSISYLLHPASGSVRGLTSVLDGDWSPDGQRIVLVVGDSSYVRTQLVVMHVEQDVEMEDWQNQELTTSSSSGIGGYRSPAWSPDGQFIAFVANTEDSRALFVFQLEGTNWRLYQLTDVQHGLVRNPRWSPDARYLYAISYNGVHRRLIWWDTQTRRLVMPDLGFEQDVVALTWSP